jgi:hypothetical protein
MEDGLRKYSTLSRVGLTGIFLWATLSLTGREIYTVKLDKAGTRIAVQFSN